MALRLLTLVAVLAAGFIYTSVAQAQRVYSPGPISAWMCIHHGEAGSWTIIDPPYEGGLQMDSGFQRTYGQDFINEHHGLGAHAWTIREQMIAANRARVGVDWRGRYIGARGFYPWPNTARTCGLI